MDPSSKSVGHPPPGAHSNFVNPVSLRTPVITVNSVFLVLATLAVVVRLYAKGFVTRAAGWDDCTFEEVDAKIKC